MRARYVAILFASMMTVASCGSQGLTDEKSAADSSNVAAGNSNGSTTGETDAPTEADAPTETGAPAATDGPAGTDAPDGTVAPLALQPWTVSGCDAIPPVDTAAAQADESSVSVCNTGQQLQLGVKRLPLSTIDDLIANDAGCWDDSAQKDPTKCAYTGLAAIEITPDGIDFGPNEALWPVVKYDLSPYGDTASPECTRLRDQVAGGLCDAENVTAEKALPFKIYRAVVENGKATDWRWSGDANLGGTADVAEGKVNHFSIHVLVALPEPTPISVVELDAEAPVESGLVSIDDGTGVQFATSFTDTGDGLGIDPDGNLHLVVRLREMAVETTAGECLRLELPFDVLTCALTGAGELTVRAGPAGLVFAAPGVEVVAVTGAWEAHR